VETGNAACFICSSASAASPSRGNETLSTTSRRASASIVALRTLEAPVRESVDVAQVGAGADQVDKSLLRSVILPLWNERDEAVIGEQRRGYVEAELRVSPVTAVISVRQHSAAPASA
jgi:hypothetical protein